MPALEQNRTGVMPESHEDAYSTFHFVCIMAFVFNRLATIDVDRFDIPGSLLAGHF
jgi:hypothetical protein